MPGEEVVVTAARTRAAWLCAAALFIGSAALAKGWEGRLTVQKGSEGKVESATFTFWNGKEEVTASVVLDAAGQKFAAEAEGRTVEAAGSISARKDGKWFKVKSFLLVLTGTFQAAEAEEKKGPPAFTFREEGGGSHEVAADGAVRKAAAAEGKTWRIAAALVEKDGSRVLKVVSMAEVRTLSGTVEARADKKGRVRSVKLSVGEGRRKSSYAVVLDAKGRELAETLNGQSVEVTAVVMGRNLRVLSIRKE